MPPTVKLELELKLGDEVDGIVTPHTGIAVVVTGDVCQQMGLWTG